jgi:hypothetical protein
VPAATQTGYPRLGTAVLDDEACTDNAWPPVRTPLLLTAVLKIMHISCSDLSSLYAIIRQKVAAITRHKVSEDTVKSIRLYRKHGGAKETPDD